jgi:hypothetical protein
MNCAFIHAGDLPDTIAVEISYDCPAKRYGGGPAYFSTASVRGSNATPTTEELALAVAVEVSD